MNTLIITEARLLNVIDAHQPLEWRRCQTRLINKFINGKFELVKNYSHPCVSFRMAADNDEFIAKLKSLLSRYDGSVEWTIKSHKRYLHGYNWFIFPSRYANLIGDDCIVPHEIREQLLKADYDYILLAYADLDKLADYIEKNL